MIKNRWNRKIAKSEFKESHQFTLQKKLASLIQRLALSKEQISKLPTPPSGPKERTLPGVFSRASAFLELEKESNPLSPPSKGGFKALPPKANY